MIYDETSEVASESSRSVESSRVARRAVRWLFGSVLVAGLQVGACAGPADLCQFDVTVVGLRDETGSCARDLLDLSLEVSSVGRVPTRFGELFYVADDCVRVSNASECSCRRARVLLHLRQPAGTYLAVARATGYGPGTATFQVAEACRVLGGDPLVLLEALGASSAHHDLSTNPVTALARKPPK